MTYTFAALRNLWKWCFAHKQRVTGGFIVILGAVQANLIFIQAYIPPKMYGFSVMALGGLVALFGYINRQQPEYERPWQEYAATPGTTPSNGG